MVINPILGPTIRGDITDELYSQTGGQGAPPKREKMSTPAVCAPTPDTVLLTVQLSDTEFPTLETPVSGESQFFSLGGGQRD